MNRVVRGSSLLIVTAIVAACAAQRDEDKAAGGRQGPEPQPAIEEVDQVLSKSETRERTDSSDIARRGNVQQTSSTLVSANAAPMAGREMVTALNGLRQR